MALTSLYTRAGWCFSAQKARVWSKMSEAHAWEDPKLPKGTWSKEKEVISMSLKSLAKDMHHELASMAFRAPLLVCMAVGRERQHCQPDWQASQRAVTGRAALPQCLHLVGRK